MYSKHIKSFLDFMKQAPEEHRIISADEAEANTQTQDILHALELDGSLSYHDHAKLSKAERVIRQKRRAAKDAREELDEICGWVTDNPGAVKSLERLLGRLRKIEKNHESRFYTPRTDIVEKTLMRKVK